MIHEGFTGDRGADGWVEWTTSDCAWSYNPSVACGDFLIVIGCGTDWGAPSDEHGLASVVSASCGDCDGPCHDEDIMSVPFAWCRTGAEAAAAQIAERMGHPAPQNVVDAVREMWFALIQEGAGGESDYV